MRMTSARLISAATRAPQRGMRCRLMAFSISDAVRCLAGEEGFGERTEGVNRMPALLRMHARDEIAERRAGELARLGQTDLGVAAEHHADRARVARHPSHDEERDDTPVGNSAAECRLRGVPMDDTLARRSWLEALEIAVGENGALGGGHGGPEKRCC